jgi:hypothetical protein
MEAPTARTTEAAEFSVEGMAGLERLADYQVSRSKWKSVGPQLIPCPPKLGPIFVWRAPPQARKFAMMRPALLAGASDGRSDEV